VTGIAIVGAVPPAAEGTGPRTQAALLDALERRGIPAWFVLLADDDAVADALARADVIALVEPRPTHAELARTARLATGPARLVLIPSGYGFCDIASRACERCPIAKQCPASDRVAIHRALTAAAELVIYASPLHRSASEQYVGVAQRTLVIPPPSVPALPDVAVTHDAVAFVGGDPVEWNNVIAWATAHPERSLVIHGITPRGAVVPANVVVQPPRGAEAQLEAIAAARTVVMLPGHPVPFGIAAAAARRAGREVVSNDRLGLASYRYATAAEADSAITGAVDAIVDELVIVANRPVTPAAQTPPLDPVLLYVHHVGLGDSVNLWSIARALVDAGARVTYAVPDPHHALLADQLPGGTVCSAATLDLDTLRRDHTIVEVTIRPGDAFAGDIVDERWIQLSLERQPSALSPMHEQFLALFARAGHALVPTRPAIALTPDELARGAAALTNIDRDRELVVAFHPGAGNPGKRWSIDRFVELADRLRARGARVVVVGGPGEDELVAKLGAGADVVSASAPLREVAALLAAVTIVVANDSGLMHVASAVGTPTLGIFGPTSERLWGPTHPYAAGVRARGADPKTALDALTVDEVERAFVALARQVAGEPPLLASRRIVASPALERIVTPDAIEWRGRAVVTVTGDDPIAPIVAACAGAPTWAQLAADFDRDLLATLLAAEVIVPLWSVRALR
jgi:hypothetical protein